MRTDRRLLKNYAFLSIGEIISRVFGVILSIYVARTLGVNAYGQLAFATAFMSFFNIFSDFGLTTLGIREIAKDKQRIIPWGTNIFTFQTGLSILLYLILIIFIIFLPVNIAIKVIILIFGLGMIPTALDMSYIFQAYERMEYIPIIRITSQFGYLIIGFILLYFSRNIISIPIASTFSLFITAAAAYILLRSKLHFRFSHIDYAQMKLIVIAAIPFVTGSLLTTIYHNLDSVFIQFLNGSVQVGYYNSGYKIINLALVFVVFVANVFFPFISSSFAENIELFKNHTIAFAQTMGILSIPVTFGGILFARELILFLYGKNFIPGVEAFKVLLLLIAIIGFNVVIGNIIVAAGMQKHNTISIAIGAGINLILNFILIPHFGIIGAAYATLIAEISVCLYLISIHLVRLKNTFNILSKFFIRPFIASLAIIPITYINPVHNLFIDIISGGIVYIVILFIIRGLPLSILKGYLKINVHEK